MAKDNFNIGDLVIVKPEGVLDDETNYDFACIGGAKAQKMDFKGAVGFALVMMVRDGYPHIGEIIGHGSDPGNYKVTVKFHSGKTFTQVFDQENLIKIDHKQRPVDIVATQTITAAVPELRDFEIVDKKTQDLLLLIKGSLPKNQIQFLKYLIELHNTWSWDE